MLKWRKIGLGAFLSLLVGCSEAEIQFADGTYGNESHWAGRWLVVNYWAEWCAPCRKEIPELNALHRDRRETGIVVLGVNYDGIEGEELGQLAERMNIEFPVLAADPAMRWQIERPQVLPTTVLINPQRQVQAALQGPQSQQSLELAVKAASMP